MPSIKEYNDKIRSLKNTQKITKTMKMVSASKLRKAQDAQANAKLYAHHITSMISRIVASVDKDSHPLLKPKNVIKNILIVIFTSDKGLCGSFNHSINKRVFRWINEHRKEYENIHMSFCGKRGYVFFQKNVTVENHYENITAKPDFKDAKKAGEDITQSFISGKYDEIYLAYNHFISPLSQETVFDKILPIDPAVLFEKEEHKNTAEYLFEPPQQELLSFLIPHYLYFKIHFALLENWAGEHGARMTAMDNATKNASDLIEKKTLLRNRARQAAITTELTEIVAGAEALN